MLAQRRERKIRPRNRALVREPVGTAVDDLTATGWNRGFLKYKNKKFDQISSN
jgi:hypothetical protein